MTGTYRINDTSTYHREYLETLGWELTVCNALEDEKSPCRSILARKTTYGNLLYDHLCSIIRLESVSAILEIGGGYGYVMRDFLKKMAPIKAAMLDLSPVMLAKQQETLKDFTVEFIHQDFLTSASSFHKQYDLILFNEILGDFPTLCHVNPRDLTPSDDPIDPLMVKVKNIFASYNLPIPAEIFNFNLGAIIALEKLCASRVKFIYISEHSSEAAVRDEMRNKIRISSPGNPEQIRLMGHDEYSVRFSHLVAVAEKFGYRVVRGQYKNFITIEHSGRVNFILTSHSSKDEHEMIRQFIEDLYKYEYIVLIKN